MATISGSVGKNGYSFWLEVSESLPSDYLSTNKSNVTVKAVIQNHGTRTNSGGWKYYLTIGGSEAKNSTGQTMNTTGAGFDGGKTTVFTVSNFSVTHNADGKKPVNISCTLSKSSYTDWDPGKCTASGNFTLTNIPRQSSVGTCTAGTTLSGPSITINKNVSSYTDNITLSYNNKTITRNSFTTGQLTFTEAERLAIFQAQGAGQTKSWTITGKTYSGSTQIGSNYTGSVNITTEALATVTSASNFNVGVQPTYSTNNPLSATVMVYAKLGAYSGGTQIYYASYTGTRTNYTTNIDFDDIYTYNTTSQSGTVYWVIESYINNTLVGTVSNKTCTYYFLSSVCAPTFSTLRYKQVMIYWVQLVHIIMTQVQQIWIR